MLKINEIDVANHHDNIMVAMRLTYLVLIGQIDAH